MNVRKKIVVEAALVVVLGAGIAVGGGAAAGALTLPSIPGLSALEGLLPVGDMSAPVGDDSAPVGDDSAPKADDDKGKDHEDDKGFDESKYHESKDKDDKGK